MTRLDPLTPTERSRQMSLIKSKDTRPELTVRKTLTRLGYRYRLHPVNVPGRPDVVIRKLHKVIFVHGCFWHRHQGCARTRTPRSRVAFWKQKFNETVRRDRSVESRLRRDGWKVLVVWECVSERAQVLERHLQKFLGESE